MPSAFFVSSDTQSGGCIIFRLDTTASVLEPEGDGLTQNITPCSPRLYSPIVRVYAAMCHIFRILMRSMFLAS